jgi:hypothetical protein
MLRMHIRFPYKLAENRPRQNVQNDRNAAKGKNYHPNQAQRISDRLLFGVVAREKANGG